MKAKGRTSTKKRYEGFTEEEKAAMQDRVKEMKVGGRRGRADQADEERELLAKIAELPEADRALGKRLHAVIKASAPELSPKLWYGMPAYYKDGKVVCHFQAAQKFKTRYATLGFSDAARLKAGLIATEWRAVEPRVHAPDGVHSALVRRIGVVDDAVLERECAHSGTLFPVCRPVRSNHRRECGDKGILLS